MQHALGSWEELRGPLGLRVLHGMCLGTDKVRHITHELNTPHPGHCRDNLWPQGWESFCAQMYLHTPAELKCKIFECMPKSSVHLSVNSRACLNSNPRTMTRWVTLNSRSTRFTPKRFSASNA